MVGINTAVVAGGQGLCFAVGADTAAWVAGEIMRHGRWRSATTMRGYLEEGTRFRATHPVHRLTFPGQPTQQS